MVWRRCRTVSESVIRRLEQMHTEVPSLALSTPVVGKIEGTTSTISFSMTLQMEGVGKNDYLETMHEGRIYLLMIKDLKRIDDRSIAECVVVGAPPRTPFIPGSEIHVASEESVRRGLGLGTSESEGVYIGRLRSMEIDVWLPIGKLTRVFVVGKPGAGKSYTMGVIAEELIKKGIPVVIVDAHGEYSSLKVPAELPSKEFRVEPRSYAEQIIEFADLNFNPGADLDISSLDSARPEDIVSMMQCTIVNLRGLDLKEQHSTVSKLLRMLLEAVMVMQIPPFFLALDEAHLFAGRVKREDARLKETIEMVKRFAQEGRKFGANMVVLTQRPQLLDTTVRSLSGTWIVHRLTDPNDVRITVESGGLGKEWEHDINWLESGDAVVTGDVVERIPLLVKVRKRETKHGAPGFNPLDFVSPEEREKMKKRMAQLKERLTKMTVTPGTPPQLPASLPSLYVPVKVDEQSLLDLLKEKKTLDSVEVLKSELRYMPALFCEVSVASQRKSPDIEFRERLYRLVPVDSSASMIDWRHESAYGLTAKEVLESQPSAETSREGRHEMPSHLLLEASSVDNLKGPLKTFTASKLTQTVLYHKDLNEYSRPGEPLDGFRSRLGEKLTLMKKNRIAEVQSAHQSKIHESRAATAAIREEYESLEKLVEGIKGELRSLEKEKTRAEREGRSTLKVSGQIQTREARLARLEKRLAELREKMLANKKGEERLEQVMKAEVLKAGKELDDLLEAPLQSIIFQPRIEEVDVGVLQLVWVPVIESLFRATFEGMTGEFKFKWNAVNGRGTFGSCAECRTAVESLDGELFCCGCGKMFCSEHLKTCASCGRGICSEHHWTCASCGRGFCLDEEPMVCAACGDRLCEDCAAKCVSCEGKAYCKSHLKTCGSCKETYCPEHYAAHVIYCPSCGRETCVIEQVKCKVCGEIFCEECMFKCSACRGEVCRKDSWTCSSCAKTFCNDEEKIVCSTCGLPVCGSCAATCSSCGAPVSRKYLKTCPNCGNQVCDKCLVEVKKLGIFRKVVCRSCGER